MDSKKQSGLEPRIENNFDKVKELVYDRKCPSCGKLTVKPGRVEEFVEYFCDTEEGGCGDWFKVSKEDLKKVPKNR